MKMSGQEGYELDYVAHVIAYRPPHRTASNTRQTWVLTAKDWILDARVRVSVNSSHLIPPLWLRPASLQQPVFVRLEGFVSTGNTTVTSDMPPTELSSTSDSRISWFNRASPPSFTSLSSSPGLLAPKVNRMSGSAFGTDEALPVYTQILSGSTSIVRDTALISRLERQWNAGPGRQDEFPSSSFASLVSSRPGPSTLRPLHLHPVANPSSGSPFLWQPHDHHQRTRTHDNSTDNAGDSNTTGLNGVYNCDLFRRPSQLRSLLSNLTGQTVSMFAVYSDDHCAQPDINSLLSSISSSTSISSRLPTLASLSSSSRKNVSQSQAPLPRDDSSHGSILNPSPTIPLTSHSLRTPSAPLLLRHALLRRVCTSCNFSSFASAVSPPSLLSSLPSLPSFPPFPSSSSWSCPMCHPCSQQLIPSQSTSHRSDHPGWTWYVFRYHLSSLPPLLFFHCISFILPFSHCFSHFFPACLPPFCPFQAVFTYLTFPSFLSHLYSHYVHIYSVFPIFSSSSSHPSSSCRFAPRWYHAHSTGTQPMEPTIVHFTSLHLFK